jgi:two-component system, NarL family, nitrate/nitrite response regulator NarL
MSTRLLLIDDHALFREGVGRLLASEPDFELVATCPNLDCGLNALKTQSPDILLDFDLGGGNTIDFVRLSRSLRPETKILIVTAGVDDRSATELIQSGVSGIFHKHNDPDSLSQRIHSVLAGNVYLEEAYLKPLFQIAQPQASEAPARLTERERTVLDCLLEGLSNKIIADRIGASEAAVKGTLQQLFQKTGVRTRSQLVRYALEQLKRET